MIVAFHTVELTQLPIPPYLNVIKTHFGMGVPLFYTLSGFVLSFGYLDALQSREQIRRFYARRFFRIAPLFYVMLAVWMLYLRSRSPTYAVGPFEFLLNVTLLFGLVPGREESLVAAGWSIGVEVLYYVIFPIVAALLTTPLLAAIAFLVFSVVSSLTFNKLQSMGVGFFAYGNLLTQLPFFLCGTAVYLVWRLDGFRLRPRVGALLLSSAVIGSWMLVAWPAAYRFLVSFTVVNVIRMAWALVLGAVILGISYWPNRVIVNRITRYFGTISFSIYLLHPLVIAFSMDEQRRIASTFGGGVLALAVRLALVFAVVIGLASLTYRFIEKTGIEWGKRIVASKRTGNVIPAPDAPPENVARVPTP